MKTFARSARLERVTIALSLICGAWLLSFSGGLAQAQQGATSDTKEQPRQAVVSSSENTTPPFSAQLLSFLYGPALNDPGSGVAPDTFRSDREGVNLQNQFSLAYNVNDQISIAPVFDFELYLSDPADQYDRAQRLSMTYDSYVRATYNNMLSADVGTSTLSLSSDVRYYVPTSDFSRDNRSPGSLRLMLTPSLSFAHSSWSLAVVNFVRYYFQRQAFMTNNPGLALPRVMYYTGPVVSYQVNDKVALWNVLEATVTYDTQGVANTTDPDRSLFDVEPGVDLKVSDHVTLSPYLNWFVNRPLNTTSINLMASVSM